MLRSVKDKIDVGRAVLLVVAVWMTLVVLGNLVDAARAAGFLAANVPIASGNLAQISEVLAKLGLSWPAIPAFGLAIALEAGAAACLWASFRRRSALLEDAAFALLILLFGGFIAVDELAVLYQLEGVHRGLVVYVAVLYVVVRLTRPPSNA